MYNNDIVKKNKPFVFTKKVSNNYKIIPQLKVKNTLGHVRYFPPTIQEWSNSVYAYNNMGTKGISIAQRNLSKIIKSYFDFFFNNKLLYGQRILTRFRRLATNKIFVSKAELKHTSTKVIVTLYVYNEERRRLIKRLKRIEATLFPSISNTFIKNKREYNLLLSLVNRYEYFKVDSLSFVDWLLKIKIYIVEEIKLEKKSLLFSDSLKAKEDKLIIIRSLLRNLNTITNILSYSSDSTTSLNYYEDIYKKYINKVFLDREIAVISYYKLLLSLNKYKFEDIFLSRLGSIISKVYKKEVEFNIINLKSVYLNSDIFTQAIALKLRNRDNSLLKVLRSFLTMVKLPRAHFFKERFLYLNIEKLWANKVNNLTVNSLTALEGDKLNNLLITLFKLSNFTKVKEINNSSKEKKSISSSLEVTNNIDLLSNIMLLLKHKNMAGIRLEAKGRLTRRFTASRSVFKMKWKGSLKDIDSSYKGLSSTILRGYAKSNIQYSIANSRTRNGAFGLKGWISGK